MLSIHDTVACPVDTHFGVTQVRSGLVFDDLNSSAHKRQEQPSQESSSTDMFSMDVGQPLVQLQVTATRKEKHEQTRDVKYIKSRWGTFSWQRSGTFTRAM